MPAFQGLLPIQYLFVSLRDWFKNRKEASSSVKSVGMRLSETVFFLRLQRHTQSYKEKYNNNQNEHVLGPSCLHCQRLASLPQKVYVALSTTCTNSSLDARQHGTSKSSKSFSVNSDQRLIYSTASRIVCWKYHAGNTMLFRVETYVNQWVVVSGCTPR